MKDVVAPFNNVLLGLRNGYFTLDLDLVLDSRSNQVDHIWF